MSLKFNYFFYLIVDFVASSGFVKKIINFKINVKDIQYFLTNLKIIMLSEYLKKH